MSNYPTKIQEIIQKRSIIKLVHFTRLKNLESIYKYGILTRDQIEKEEILEYLKDKIASWWLPDDVVFVDEIPHTATGKIQKLALREKFKEYKLEVS